MYKNKIMQKKKENLENSRMFVEYLSRDIFQDGV
jgi:hypothetical protein